MKRHPPDHGLKNPIQPQPTPYRRDRVGERRFRLARPRHLRRGMAPRSQPLVQQGHHRERAEQARRHPGHRRLRPVPCRLPADVGPHLLERGLQEPPIMPPKVQPGSAIRPPLRRDGQIPGKTSSASSLAPLLGDRQLLQQRLIVPGLGAVPQAAEPLQLVLVGPEHPAAARFVELGARGPSRLAASGATCRGECPDARTTPTATIRADPSGHARRREAPGGDPARAWSRADGPSHAETVSSASAAESPPG